MKIVYRPHLLRRLKQRKSNQNLAIKLREEGGKHMRKTNKREKIFYDKKSDALWLLVKSGIEEEHREISPGISIELGKKGELLGIEILNASKVLKPLINGRQTLTQLQ